MNGAFEAILFDCFCGDRAHDAFKELLLCLLLHRFERRNPSAEVRNPVGPTLHLGKILKPQEWKGISLF